MIRKVADPQQEYWEKIMKEGIDKKASDEVVDGVDEDEDIISEGRRLAAGHSRATVRVCLFFIRILFYRPVGLLSVRTD